MVETHLLWVDMSNEPVTLPHIGWLVFMGEPFNEKEEEEATNKQLQLESEQIREVPEKVCFCLLPPKRQTSST